MIHELIFVAIMIHGIYSNFNKKDILRNITLKSTFMSLFIMAIFIPFIEEILFRYTLKNYLRDVQYGDYINSIIFGLMHSTNYLAVGNSVAIFKQVLITTYAGYYYLQLDNVLHSFIYHMIWNAAALVLPTVALYCYKKFVLKRKSPFYEHTIYCLDKHKDDFCLNYGERIYKNKFIPAVGTITLKSINVYDLPEDMVERYRKYKL